MRDYTLLAIWGSRCPNCKAADDILPIIEAVSDGRITVLKLVDKPLIEYKNLKIRAQHVPSYVILPTDGNTCSLTEDNCYRKRVVLDKGIHFLHPKQADTSDVITWVKNTIEKLDKLDMLSNKQPSNSRNFFYYDISRYTVV